MKIIRKDTCPYCKSKVETDENSIEIIWSLPLPFMEKKGNKIIQPIVLKIKCVSCKNDFLKEGKEERVWNKIILSD